MSTDPDRARSSASFGREADALDNVPAWNVSAWRVMPAMRAPYAQSDSGDAIVLKSDDGAAAALAAGMRIHEDATIQVRVRELRGSELGLLDLPAGDDTTLERVKAQAMSRKIAEDAQWFGLDHAAALDPQRNSYFGSDAHIAWSEAMRLRCAGRLDAQWLREFDPYGGTLSQGAMILPGGAYPHSLSKLSMCHRSDWNLGRFFDAGPLSGLYDSDVKQPELGFYGLSRQSSVMPKLDVLYGFDGHPDWKVEYLQQPHSHRLDRASEPSVALAQSGSEARTPYPERFGELMQCLAASGLRAEQRQDCAAALLEGMIAAQFKLDRPVSAILGSKDNVIAISGEGDAAQRIAVDVAATEGAYARWSKNPAAALVSVAVSGANESEPDRRQPDKFQPDEPQLRETQPHERELDRAFESNRKQPSLG
jgi:hypothetical protein